MKKALQFIAVIILLASAFYAGYSTAIHMAEPFTEAGIQYIDFGIGGVHYYE